MSQAIMTKFLPANGRSGARIRATAWAGTVTVPYDHGLSGAAPYAVAARALAEKLQWEGTYVPGGFPNGDYVFVNVEDGQQDGFTFAKEGAA